MFGLGLVILFSSIIIYAGLESISSVLSRIEKKIKK